MGLGGLYIGFEGKYEQQFICAVFDVHIKLIVKIVIGKNPVNQFQFLGSPQAKQA